MKASIEDLKNRPGLERSPAPDLYLPAMPPLWLLDYARFLVRWIVWRLLRHYRHGWKRRRRGWKNGAGLSRLPVILLLVVVSACDGRGIKASDCSATRVAAWASDVGPRYDRLIEIRRQYRCGHIVSSGISEKSIDSIADRCERIASRLEALLNEVKGYLSLAQRRNACENGAPGLSPLPDKLRARLKAIEQELGEELDASSSRSHWTPGDDFCRYC